MDNIENKYINLNLKLIKIIKMVYLRRTIFLYNIFLLYVPYIFLRNNFVYKITKVISHDKSIILYSITYYMMVIIGFLRYSYQSISQH